MHVAHQVVAFFMYTQNGYTPLLSASQEGHDGIVEMLLQAGASVDLQAKVSIDVTNFDPKKSLKEISQLLTFQKKLNPDSLGHSCLDTHSSCKYRSVPQIRPPVVHRPPCLFTTKSC